MQTKLDPPPLLLAIVAALPSIYAVLFTPALPAIGTSFNVSFGVLQQTMVFYLLGYALGQLPYGPLSNCFGRKKTFYLGMGLAVISSLIGVIAGRISCFWLFVAARFFMAFGACVGLNVAFTIVGDLYHGARALKVLSFIMLLSAIIPGISSFTGGIIANHFSWEGCFYFLAIFGILMILLCRAALPETKTETDRGALKIKNLINTYLQELKNKQLILSATITGCGASMIYLFASAAPFIGISRIGLSPEQYGFLTIIPACGLFIGSFLTRNFAQALSFRQFLWTGCGIVLIASLSLLLLFLADAINVYSLFGPMLLTDFGLAMIFSTTAATALTRAYNKSIGSSLMSFINLSLTVFSVIILSLFSIQKILILPILFFAIAIVICILLAVLCKMEIE